MMGRKSKGGKRERGRVIVASWLLGGWTPLIAGGNSVGVCD